MFSICILYIYLLFSKEKYFIQETFFYTLYFLFNTICPFEFFFRPFFHKSVEDYLKEHLSILFISSRSCHMYVYIRSKEANSCNCIYFRVASIAFLVVYFLVQVFHNFLLHHLFLVIFFHPPDFFFFFPFFSIKFLTSVLLL